MTQIPQILKEYLFQTTRLLDLFPVGSQEYRRILLFLVFSYFHILLNRWLTAESILPFYSLAALRIQYTDSKELKL